MSQNVDIPLEWMLETRKPETDFLLLCAADSIDSFTTGLKNCLFSNAYSAVS